MQVSALNNRCRLATIVVLTVCLLVSASILHASESDCIALHRVDIDESEIFSEDDQQKLLMPLLGSCIDASLIRNLLSIISNFYIDNSYVTTRPYLLEQDILDGQIEIRILKGFIESIVDAESGLANGKISTAFLFHDPVLNLRDLETALETIERVPSVEASFEILPGSEQGGSIVEIKTVEAPAFRIDIGSNAQTDRDPQLSLQASFDNPFNINDILEFRQNTGSIQETYQTNQGEELNYSFPLGSMLFELNWSDVSFRQRIQGINDNYLSSGDTVSGKLKISKVLTRSQASKISLALSLLHKDTEAFFEDVLIDVSSYKTTQAQLDLVHTQLFNWGQITTSYAYHKGLNSLGARDDDYFTLEDGFQNEAKLQFDKVTIDSYLRYYFDNSAYQASLNLHLQYSDDILFDNDKLSLGSNYTVRGYSYALSGSKAWYLRSNISKTLQTLKIPFSGRTFSKTLSMSFGLDYGEVICDLDNREFCGDIYGLGLAVKVSDSNFSGSLLWGHPLKEIAQGIGDEEQFTLDLRWTF